MARRRLERDPPTARPDPLRQGAAEATWGRVLAGGVEKHGTVGDVAGGRAAGDETVPARPAVRGIQWDAAALGVQSEHHAERGRVANRTTPSEPNATPHSIGVRQRIQLDELTR